MHFDELLVILGPFGRFQKLYFFVIGLAGIPAAFYMMAIVFLAATPDHMCDLTRIGKRLNLDGESLRNLTIPLETRGGTIRYSQCLMYDLNYTKMSSQVVVDLITTSDREDWPVKRCSSWWYNNSVYKSSIVTQWDLVCDSDWLVSTSTSVYMAGLMCGILMYGALSDKFGRRRTLLLALVTTVSLNIGLAFSPNFMTFLVLRFFLAVNALGVFTTAFVLVIEMAGPAWRVTTGIAIMYFWSAGYLLVALAAYFLRDWFRLQLALSVPLLILFSWFFLVPESPRWLYANNKHEEADKIMAKMAKMNKTQLPEKLQIIMQKQQKASICDLVRTPNLRKKSANIFFNWFVNSFVYYGLSLNTSNLGGDDYVNFLLSGAVEIPANIFCQVSLQYLGRRLPLCGAMVVAGMLLLITSAIPKNLNWLIVALSTGGKLAITASFSIVYVFSAELYPTVVRGIGICGSSMCARLGGVLAPLINQHLGKVNRVIPVVVFGVSSITAGLLALALPETKGHNLPETIQDGEEFGSKVVLITDEETEDDPADRGIVNPVVYHETYI